MKYLIIKKLHTKRWHTDAKYYVLLTALVITLVKNASYLLMVALHVIYRRQHKQNISNDIQQDIKISICS